MTCAKMQTKTLRVRFHIHKFKFLPSHERRKVGQVIVSDCSHEPSYLLISKTPPVDEKVPGHTSGPLPELWKAAPPLRSLDVISQVYIRACAEGVGNVLRTRRCVRTRDVHWEATNLTGAADDGLLGHTSYLD